MNTKKTWWAFAAVAAMTFVGTRAKAAVGTPSYLNIDVAVTASLSVSVNGVNSSTYSGVNWNTSNANQELVAASSTTVINDSNVVEKWQLSSNARSINTLGTGTTWLLKTSTSPVLPSSDEFAVQAVFGSSRTVAGGCPGAGAATWQDGNIAKLLDNTPTDYTTTQFADPSLNADGAPFGPDAVGNTKLPSNGQRVLCWRIVTPAATTTTDTQNVQLIVTAAQ